MKKQPIDYKEFESEYWKPEPGSEYTLVVTDWGMIYTDFGRGGEMKPAITMNVVSVDDEVYAEPKEFTTCAQSFARDFRVIEERAKTHKRAAIRMLLSYDKTKQYSLVDKSEEAAQ